MIRYACGSCIIGYLGGANVNGRWDDSYYSTAHIILSHSIENRFGDGTIRFILPAINHLDLETLTGRRTITSLEVEKVCQ